VYDPTFFVAFGFVKEHPVVVGGVARGNLADRL
jgi:ABC-type uncharacterized transport system substrate-binding protein